MLWKEKDKILIVSPHISDAVMMAGGSMAKWAEQKKIVGVLSLGPTEFRDIGNEKKAARMLGFKIVDGVKKQEVGSYDAGKCFEIIKEKIKEIRPDVIITVSAKEVQHDHLITYRATRDAVYYASREVYWEFEVEYKPQLFVTDCIESFSFIRANQWEELDEEHVVAKRRALLVYDYTPEAGPSPHFDVVHDSKWVNSLAELRGLWVGCGFAEVFQREEL
jgi:LmbE family N-acetylglucosaminyl deacetylase